MWAVKQIRNHYQELAVTVQQAAGQNRQLVLRFRLFDDGVGFRVCYEFPEQANPKHFTVSDEKTEFSLPADHQAFWMRRSYDPNEYLYSTKRSERHTGHCNRLQSVCSLPPIF